MFRHILSVLLLSVVFTIIFWIINWKLQGNISYISPLPDFLTHDKNKQVTLLDLWYPFLGTHHSEHPFSFELSNLTSKSAMVYDLTTDTSLFDKNVRTRRPMASLTKIMTAIISLENKRSDNNYVVKNEDLVGEDSMGLVAGERLTQEELLYGLMLPSGNDASEVLARNFEGGGRAGFIQAMNDKGKALGLTDTNFDNPSGLQGDGIQYSTVHDLLVITKYALDNFPDFQKIVSTKEYKIQENSLHKEYNLSNETNLLATYPGVKGVKTGYTPEAGLCLVTYLDYGGHRIIGIILNSENRRKEMKELLDYSLNSLGIVPPEYTGG